MESPLEVLSRAATMVQDSANESRLTAKELPTTKWRRDRRMRAASEYQHSLSSQNSPSMGAASVASPPASPPIMRPLCESTNRTALPIIESPIDMSVTSTTMKPRASPPPPYREPLPGSTFATTLARPSVITQAPPKRGDSRDSILISNRENDNQSTESISMCETVIDEHFRRSLGPDYVALFGKKSPVPSTPSPTPTPTPTPPPLAAQHQLAAMAPTAPSHLHQNIKIEHHRSTPTPPAAVNIPQALTTKPILSPVSPPEQSPPHVTAARVDSPALTHRNETTTPPSSSLLKTETPTTTQTPTVSSTPSVDDHFAKALGDTWKKLQADKEQRN